jgi:hypothetical protein
MTSHAFVEAGFHTTETSTPKEATGIPGEHLIGIVFAVSALMGGGWFFWALARALETYRVY